MMDYADATNVRWCPIVVALSRQSVRDGRSCGYHMRIGIDYRVGCVVSLTLCQVIVMDRRSILTCVSHYLAL